MLTASDLTGMREVQVLAMMDTCKLVSRTVSGADAFGNPVAGWSEQESACGFDALIRQGRSSYEVMPGTDVPVFDARLRLPLTANVTNLDRVRITKRFGETLTKPLLFEVVGNPMRGPTCLVLNLRSVISE